MKIEILVSEERTFLITTVEIGPSMFHQTDFMHKTVDNLHKVWLPHPKYSLLFDSVMHIFAVIMKATGANSLTL